MSKPKKGHNADAIAAPEMLKAYVERIERIEEDQAALADDKKVVYAEVKASGLNPQVVRAVIRRRKLDQEKLREFEEMIDLYRAALGDLAETPLGKSAEPKMH